MKKNLRIVSAAAAALLAVAPVAATSVTTALADINMSGEGGTTTSAAVAKLTLTVNNALSLVKNDPASKLQATLSYPTLPTGATVTTATTSKTAQIYKSDSVEINDKGKLVGVNGTTTTETLPETVKNFGDATQKYVAVGYVTIGGLDKGKEYTIDLGGTKVTMTASESGVIANLPVISKSFTVTDPTLIGAPYLRQKKIDATGSTPEVPAVAVSSGSVNLTTYNVNSINTAITNKYEVKTTTTSNAAATDTANNVAASDFINLEQDIRDGLKAAGVTVKSDDSFDKPATPFTVNVRMYANNGKTNVVAVTVNPDPTNGDKTYPQISWKVKGASDTTKVYGTSNTIDSIDSLDDVSFNYVPINGVVDVAAIKKAFTVQVSGYDITPLAYDVDVSKVNTKVAGKYPVVLTATNTDTKKTTKVTFYLTVGAKGATYRTVQSDGDVPVYKIEGNTVTNTTTTVKNGDQIAIFGEPVKIGDKTYAKINSADSDLYVESKYVDGSFKPAEKTKKTIMHNSYIYDKDHKRVGTNMLKAYSTVEVIGKSTKLADGSLVYQIGDNQYVMADNIDGTARVLSHNAYVYKTSKKRANGKKLLKGSTVTTYGSPYTFKNGKAYYRVGGPAKQYVKVANFK